MRLIARQGSIVLSGASEAIVPHAVRWFGVEGKGPSSTGDVEIDPKRVLALSQYYRDKVDISPAVRGWIEDLVLRKIPAAISRRLTDYRGGYQADAIRQFAQKKQVYAGIDAGGGKTIIACEAASLFGPTLLCVPPIIWNTAYIGPKGDITRWYRHLRIADATEGQGLPARKRALRKRADLYVVSPHTISGLSAELMELPIAVSVVDEATLISNQASKKAQTAIKVIRPMTEYRLALSAHPAPSDIGELWAQMEFLSPGTLGSWEDFGKRYGVKSRWGWDFRDADRAVEALALVRDRMILLPASSFWTDSPTLSIRELVVELGQRERQAYETMEANHRLRLGSDRFGDEIMASAGMPMGVRMKLREITSGFVYDSKIGRPHAIGERTKQRATISLIRRSPREQFIVWGQFSEELRMIESACLRRNISAGYYTGNNRASRDILERFMSRKIQVLIANPASIGHGVRLECATQQIFASMPDSADQFYQSIKRSHRPPQTKPVTVHLLVASGTVDEEILANQKTRMVWRERMESALLGA